MKTSRQRAAAWIMAIAVLCGGGSWVRGQEGAAQPQQPPTPPEVQRLIDLMQDPDQMRALMDDPNQMRDLMRSLESDEVREFMSDPERMRGLMRNVDLQRVQETMRAVDPAKIRTAMSGRLRERLGATEDEWKVLEPKIQALVAAQQATRVRFRGVPGGGGGGRGGFNPLGGGLGAGGGPSPEQADLAAAAERLQAAAQDPNAAREEVKARLADYRAARERARQKQEAAERELRELLTARQEGVLMMMGILN